MQTPRRRLCHTLFNEMQSKTIAFASVEWCTKMVQKVWLLTVYCTSNLVQRFGKHSCSKLALFAWGCTKIGMKSVFIHHFRKIFHSCLPDICAYDFAPWRNITTECFSFESEKFPSTFSTLKMWGSSQRAFLVSLESPDPLPVDKILKCPYVFLQIY